MSNNNGIASGFFFVLHSNIHETIASKACNKIQTIFTTWEKQFDAKFTSTALTNIHQSHSSTRKKMRKLYKLLRRQASKPFLFIAANWTKKIIYNITFFSLWLFTICNDQKSIPKNHPTGMKMWEKQLLFFVKKNPKWRICMSDGFTLFPWCCCYLVLNRHSNPIDDNKSILHIYVGANWNWG